MGWKHGIGLKKKETHSKKTRRETKEVGFIKILEEFIYKKLQFYSE